MQTRIIRYSGGLEFNREWGAASVGFMLLMRPAELAASEIRVVTFGVRNGAGYVCIFIRRPGKDREGIGAPRSPNETRETLRPVDRSAEWVKRANSTTREAPVSGAGVLPLVTLLVKWAASEHNSPPPFPDSRG